MKILFQELQDELNCAANAALKESLAEPLSLEITRATQSQFGHYQCNSAMKLAKLLKKSPREIAEKIVGYIQSHPSKTALIEKVEIAGPGFINIHISPSTIEQKIQQILKDPHLGVPTIFEKKRVIIDFSSPNTAKEMHVGHLRSTIIGDSLARLFEFLGYDVLRLNHIGDWGTSFGMLIAYLKERAPEVLNGKEEMDLTRLVLLYKQAKALFDQDPEFKKRSQLSVVLLQSGDAESNLVWEKICDISRKSYEKIYDILDIHLIERGESFYNPFLAKTIQELEHLGLIQNSDGAKCIFLEGFVNRDGEPLPLMLQKSDGGYNYATTDMAAIHHRIKEEKGSRLIYVTDAGQAQHFQMIFKAAIKAGWLDPNKVRVDHVPFGLV